MIDPYSLLRPWLFCLDPEQAHNLTLSNLDRAQRWSLLEPEPRARHGARDERGYKRRVG